jgi:wyosine [tRNA(Phe)-imidazoG37] synthetase (radical SAM superfamily)
VAEVTRTWRDNAFWHDLNTKDKLEGILIINDDQGRVITQQLTVKKYNPDGNHNPDFQQLLDQVGDEKITANTESRLKKKAEEAEKKKKETESKRMVSELERLFEAKVRTLEIEEIKNSENRELKTRLRRSKNIIEMQTIAQLIMMEQMGVKFVIEEKNEE